MGGRRRVLRWAPGLLLTGLLVLAGAGPAAADAPHPTADPHAPTPTAPYRGRPPQGSAPDGSAVGGPRLATRGVVVADGAPRLPAGIAAAGWLVADARTGVVLAARDPHGRYYPASTLKTLTVLTLQPLLDPRRVIVGTTEDENIEGTRVGLIQGGRYPVALLFQALVLQSGNDAANALARAAGGVDLTVRAMNSAAASMGAYDTVAGTPSGLDVAGQSSSAYDLALFFRALLARPAAAAILRTPTAQLPGVPGKNAGYQIQNQDPLLHTYPGNLGGKTGFTDAARHTFVTAAERNGRRLVVSIMDTERVPLTADQQAARLLDWGFSVPAGTSGVGTLVTPADLAAHTAVPPPTTHAPRLAPVLPVPSSAAGPASSAVVPGVLGAGAVLIVLATLLGRRRARRSSALPERQRTPPAATGVSPSTRP